MFVRKSIYDAAIAERDTWQDRAQRERNQADANAVALGEAQRELQWTRAELSNADARAGEAQSRLAFIIAMETPGMAHVGRKAVRIARGEVL